VWEGCTKPGSQVSQSTKFWTLKLNIFGSSVWNLLLVTHLVPRILRWSPHFYTVFAPFYVTSVLLLLYLTVLIFWIFGHNFVVWFSQNILSEASVQGQDVIEFEKFPTEHILSKVVVEDLHCGPKLRFWNSKECVECHGFTCCVWYQCVKLGLSPSVKLKAEWVRSSCANVSLLFDSSHESETEKANFTFFSREGYNGQFIHVEYLSWWH